MPTAPHDEHPAGPTPLDVLAGAPLAALRWLDRRPAWTLGIPVVLLGAATAALLFDPRVFHGGDNALYWALGRSLALHHEYRNLVQPGAPYETSIPWGFPLLVAAAMELVPGGTEPGGYVALKAVPFACAVAAVACLWALLQHLLRGQRGLALLAALLLVLNHRLMCYGSLLLSEAPYLLLSLAALVAYARVHLHGPRRWWSAVPAAALASCAYLVRPVGVALLAALLATLALERRGTALAAAALVIAAIAGSWHLRAALVPSEQENLYLSYAVKRSKHQVTDERVDLAGLVDRVRHNAVAYAGGPLRQLALGGEDRDTSDPPWLAIVAVLGLTALGFACSAGRAGPTHAYLVLYLGVLLLWLPEAVRTRYLALAYALMVPLALLGLWRLALAWSPRAAAWAVVAAASAGLWLTLPPTASRMATLHLVRRAVAAGQEQPGRGTAVRSYVEMCRWIGDHAEPGAVLAARKPRLAYLYSGRSAVRITYASDPDQVYDWLLDHGIDLLLMDDLYTPGGATRIRLGPTVRDHRAHFREVWRTASGDRVLRFAADPRDLRGVGTPAGRGPTKPRRREPRGDDDARP